MPILSAQSQLLPNLACGIAAIPFAVGIGGLFKGREIFALADFPPVVTPEAQRLGDATARMFAVRNFVIGSLIFAIRYSGDRKLLGAATIIISTSAAVDGFVSLDYIGGGTMNHFPVVPVAFAVGGGLLGWFG